MSASVAVQIDDFSLMIVAYILTAVSDTDSTYFIAMVRLRIQKLLFIVLGV